MKNSVWTNSVNMPCFPRLKGNAKTDVLIIGGGLCGILCAYNLQQAGVNYILVEGSKLASGTTKNTTAKITSQHGLIYSKLIKNAGREKAQMYLNANEKAIKEYEKLCKNIDCDYTPAPAYTYTLTNAREIEEEAEAVNSLGYNATLEENPELPFRTKGAIRFEHQAQFNPLKFIAEISKNLNIYEDTFITDITSRGAVYDDGVIKAEKIIVATHFPFINRHGSYFLKMYQHRSYVLGFKDTPAIEGMYVDADLKGLSFRSYGDLLLIGGGSHRTGKHGGSWQEIESFARKHYPDAKSAYMWAAQDCMSLDGVPYIGHYSMLTPNLYVATGFNKWGITSSMVAAEILTDMVLGKENDFKEVFSPHRSILKPQLAINGLESTVNLLTPTKKRCPHLGCALKWNKNEHTWDCPCHGSRFEAKGKLIDNPATKNMK